MTNAANEILKKSSSKYIWWQTPDEALKRPDRVVIQVMNIGDFNDVTAVLETVGEEYARELLIHAEAGQFSPRSWPLLAL